MAENISDQNQLTMMLVILKVYTKYLKDDITELKITDLEDRWKQLLSTLHSCFDYIQAHNIDAREYKDDLREIIENLYVIQKAINNRKGNKVLVLDDVAKGIIFVAEKIDDILESIGWRRVVAPITIAIFEIPKKIFAMLSGNHDDFALTDDAVQRYLPPPITSVPSPRNTPTITWESNGKEESFARQLLRQMRDRIERAGKE